MHKFEVLQRELNSALRHLREAEYLLESEKEAYYETDYVKRVEGIWALPVVVRFVNESIDKISSITPVHYWQHKR